MFNLKTVTLSKPVWPEDNLMDSRNGASIHPMTSLVSLVFVSVLTIYISLQTIAWMQLLKVGPVRTSSDHPDSPPTLQSRTPSQSVTTTPMPVPQRVANSHFVVAFIFHFSFWLRTNIQVQLLDSTFCRHVYSLSDSALLSNLSIYIQTRKSFICFFPPAYRMPRRRFSTGGDEESWSHSLQRVRASLFSFFLQHLG